LLIVGFKRILISLFVMALSCPGIAFATGGIGFQASLDNPPSYISSYIESQNKLSVAIYPKSYPVLSRTSGNTPKLERVSASENSLTFNTMYYRRGHIEKKLVPVSVGAHDYVNYKNQINERDLFTDLSSRQIVESTRKRGGGGLGITVALPKRLDKVFGEGGAGLRVSGFRRITFSGRSQWTDAADNDTYQKNKFPSLNMEQVSRFDITGTIGSKITVKVSQDNQNDIPLANRIQIRYKGDEDDILKTIELGNTNLNLPNTRFVGYSSRIQGLFGVKVAAQVGGLTLTGIASQEKGSSEKASFTASGEEKATFYRDYDYVECRIFDLGLPRDSLRSADEIKALYIYELETQKDELEAYYANLRVDPSQPELFNSEAVELVRVKQLEENLYTLEQDRDKNRHYVVFNSSRNTTRDLGYYMEIERDGSIIRFGDISKDTLELKLLYRNNANSNPNQQTWQLMWRNCYRIPSGVSIDDLNLKIYKGLNGTEKSTSNLDYQNEGGITQSYIEILGLDQYDNGSIDKKVPDEKVDARDEVFRSDWGLVIFPDREPFNSDTFFVSSSNDTTVRLEEKVSTIYNYTSSTEKTNGSQYYLTISTVSRSSIIKLNKTNIIEGSETVMLNGQPLTKDVDYSIQYDYGQITLLTDLATNDPNADIAVDFEYAPFFAVQKKTLFGVRGEYKYSDNFTFGTTVLYKSDKAEERKPRVGQETATMTVLDFDASLKLQPKFLTSMTDALPLIETDKPSNLSISGEVAQSRPNPNVDNIAFVDDFESAIENLTLGTTRSTWQKSSRPYHLLEGIDRGRMLWHTPRELVDVEDVYDREAAQGEGTLRTLRMVFRPNIMDTVVIDSVTPEGDTVETISDIVSNPRPTWCGVMRYFGSRVDAKRAQLFEIRANISSNFMGKMHFDFGIINEDINGNGLADSEDLSPQDEVADEEEDVGFDGLADVNESFYDKNNNPDPNGDNWFFLGEGKCPLPEGECDNFINNKGWKENDSLYFEWLNGTEGNRVDVSVYGDPDEEALSSGGFERNDSYQSFVIDFSDPSSKFYSDSLKVEGSELGEWVTYRIPIRDSSFIDQIISSDTSALEPDWSSIKHVRVWWESALGQQTPDTIEVAAWYFVQSNWQDSVIYHPLSDPNADDATSFVVASISEDENPAFKSTPAESYKDPSSQVTEPRKGLSLRYENLHDKDTCLSTKELLTVDSYSGYRSLEMYVYSDIEEEDVGKVKMLFRLGEDEENYYEQQRILYPGWNEKNFIDIDFNDITVLKDEGQSNLVTGEILDISSGDYRVYGDPNINEVRYFAVGLINTDTAEVPELLNGEVWLDEIRVTDVRRDIGMAGRITVTGNMADLLNYSFSMQSQDPYFRGVSAATRGGSSNNLGSGKTQTSFNFNTTMNFEKFFPRSWGSRIPISFTYSKSKTTPLLRTNSDIILPEDTRQEEQSISETHSVSVSESFSKKGNNLLFNILLNRFNSSFSYRRSYQRTVNKPYNLGENYTVNSSFNFGITKVPTVPIFFWTAPIPILKKISDTRFSLYPSTWRASGNYTRNLTVSDDINDNRRTSLVRTFNGSMDLTYKVFQNLTATYRYSTKRDLSDPDLLIFSFSPKKFKLGLETNFNENLSTTYKPNLLSFLTTNFNYKSTYRDDYNRSTQARNSAMTSSWGVSGSFDHMKLLGRESKRGTGQYRSKAQQFKRKDGDEKKEGGGKPIYEAPLSLLRFLTGWIKPVSYNYNTSYNNSIPGLVDRPGLKYRFGFTRDIGVSTVDDTRSPSSSETETYNIGSGFTLLGGITTDVKYSQSVNRDLVTTSKRYENVSTSCLEPVSNVNSKKP